MSFNKELHKSIDKIINNKIKSYIDDLLDVLPDNCSITKEQLLELWNKKQVKSTRKKSAYINWASGMRPKIKTTHPNLSFSDVAKKLGEEWRKLSDEEKAKYKV
jgi:hypothetical protein